MRFLFFITLVAVGLSLPWQFFMVALFLYVFYFEGIEVLFIAFLFDGYAGMVVPWLPIPAIYTLATLGMLVFVWGLKPLFLIESRLS